MIHIAARNYLGTPFAHQGRTAAGCDCVGLLYLACADTHGYAHYLAHDIRGYSRDPHRDALTDGLRRAFGSPVEDMRVGDVVAIAFPRLVRHVAVVGDYPLGGFSLIHAWNKAGKVVEHRLDERWQKLIRHIYRPEPKV